MNPSSLMGLEGSMNLLLSRMCPVLWDWKVLWTCCWAGCVQSYGTGRFYEPTVEPDVSSLHSNSIVPKTLSKRESIRGWSLTVWDGARFNALVLQDCGQLTLTVDLSGHWTDDGYHSHNQHNAFGFHFCPPEKMTLWTDVWSYKEIMWSDKLFIGKRRSLLREPSLNRLYHGVLQRELDN
jgi:hypothetical protein